MASQLLVVVGHKVNEIINSNFDANLHAILSTNLASWLKSLGPPDYRIYTIKCKTSLLELMVNNKSILSIIFFTGFNFL